MARNWWDRYYELATDPVKKQKMISVWTPYADEEIPAEMFEPDDPRSVEEKKAIMRKLANTTIHGQKMSNAEVAAIEAARVWYTGYDKQGNKVGPGTRLKAAITSREPVDRSPNGKGRARNEYRGGVDTTGTDDLTSALSTMATEQAYARPLKTKETVDFGLSRAVKSLRNDDPFATKKALKTAQINANLEGIDVLEPGSLEWAEQRLREQQKQKDIEEEQERLTGEWRQSQSGEYTRTLPGTGVLKTIFGVDQAPHIGTPQGKTGGATKSSKKMAHRRELLKAGWVEPKWVPGATETFSGNPGSLARLKKKTTPGATKTVDLLQQAKVKVQKEELDAYRDITGYSGEYRQALAKTKSSIDKALTKARAAAPAPTPAPARTAKTPAKLKATKVAKAKTTDYSKKRKNKNGTYSPGR